MLRLDYNLVFTIINLLILFVLLKKFLFGPVIEVMEKRKALIDEQFSSAANAQKQAEQMKTEYEAAFKDADAKAAGVIADAKQSAQAEYERIVSNANAEAARIVSRAEENIVADKQKALQDMESEIASIAMHAATQVIRDQASGLDNVKLYDEFLSKAGDAGDTDIH